MKKFFDSKTEIFLDIAGLGALGISFGLWLKNAGYNGGRKGLAALCCLLAGAVYIGFVRRRTGPVLPAPAEEKADKNIYLKIFFSYLAVSCITLGLIFAIRYVNGHDSSFFRSLMVRYDTDGRHYLDIAREGYLSTGRWDRLVQLVFLPGYPVAIKAAAFFTGDYLMAAYMVSVLCFCRRGCVFYRLLKQDYGHNVRIRGVKYLAIYPGAFFFSAAMSEGLFLLCRLLCRYLVKNKRYLTGGLFGAAAAFTRSVGILLPAFMIIEYITGPPKDDKKQLTAKILSVVIAISGFAAYMWINYLVSGNPLQFMYYQKVHWTQGFGWFYDTVAYQLSYMISADNIIIVVGMWLPNLVAIFAALAVMVPASRKLHPAYTAFFIAYFFIAIGATWLLSAPRYLAALFPIQAGLALLTENKKTDRAATVLCLARGIAYLYAFALRWCVW